jgi:signal transduction histidine kinase
LRGAPGGGDRWGGSDGVRTMVVRTEEHRAVLVVRTRRGKARAGLAHAAETAAALGPVLDRRRLLEHMSQSTAQLLAAVDRRLTRFGFDVHDGPLQRMSLLAGELALLNRQLPLLVPDDASRTVAERRVTELAEAASDVTHDLRELAHSAGGRPTAPLVVQLGRDVLEFERRTGIAVHLAIEGDVDRTTDSQRIAVARVVEEALANIAEHSRAAAVRVTLRRDLDALHLTVEDDGKGFDVERSLSRAGREGRLGLGSMRERVRMLGGRLEITSRRGGPTIVTAVLPAWDVSEPSLSAALVTRARKAR